MSIVTALFALSSGFAQAPLPLLKHSDVAFMYAAEPSVYRGYGATVLAWGSTPSEGALSDARECDVTYFGSVGMVTEFAAFINGFPTYEEAICLDVHGERLRVPWLWDHEHNGVPAYWFCTNQSVFREFLEQRVREIVEKGADGLHVDDHLGTAGNSWLGGCYCARCMDLYPKFLEQNATPERLAAAGVDDAAELDYRQLILDHLSATPDDAEKRWNWPLAHEFAVFQSDAAADFMIHLRELAAKTAGRPVPVCANAGVPNMNHLSDHHALDFLACEVHQGAESPEPNDGVAFAYRMAEAVGRPVTATASGQDWAFIKETNHEGLVRIWVAQAYALGQFFMAPHYQWCYTKELGTHWYNGPAEAYAWVYRFARESANLLDGHETVAPVGVLVSADDYRSGKRECEWAAAELARAGVPFRVVLAGDDMVRSDLFALELAKCRVLVMAATQTPGPGEQELIDEAIADDELTVVADAASVIADPNLRILVDGADTLWAAPRRTADGHAVIHVINRAYDRETRQPVLTPATLSLAPALVGAEAIEGAVLHQAGAEPIELDVAAVDGRVEITVPAVELWGIIELR